MTTLIKIQSRVEDRVLYEIQVPDDVPIDLHMKHAVEGAVREGVSLQNADLSGSNLQYVKLDGADLSGADLSGANLSFATLYNANLKHTNLYDVDLSHANLCNATLGGSHLTKVKLNHTNLTLADLRFVNLRTVNLNDISSMKSVIGNSREIKSIQTDIWEITYTHTHMQIGCQLFTIEKWWDMDDFQINYMEGRALAWWNKWKPILQQIITVSPATPCDIL